MNDYPNPFVNKYVNEKLDLIKFNNANNLASLSQSIKITSIFE